MKLLSMLNSSEQPPFYIGLKIVLRYFTCSNFEQAAPSLFSIEKPISSYKCNDF